MQRQYTTTPHGPYEMLSGILHLEVLLYHATRNTEWMLSCYGLSEETILKEQFNQLAVIIDSMAAELLLLRKQDSLNGLIAINDTKQDIDADTRCNCFHKLLLAHRHIISCLKEFSEEPEQGTGLRYIVEEAIEMHYRMTERLNLPACETRRGFESCYAEPQEAAFLFI